MLIDPYTSRVLGTLGFSPLESLPFDYTDPTGFSVASALPLPNDGMATTTATECTLTADAAPVGLAHVQRFSPVAPSFPQPIALTPTPGFRPLSYGRVVITDHEGTILATSELMRDRGGVGTSLWFGSGDSAHVRVAGMRSTQPLLIQLSPNYDSNGKSSLRVGNRDGRELKMRIPENNFHFKIKYEEGFPLETSQASAATEASEIALAKSLALVLRAELLEDCERRNSRYVTYILSSDGYVSESNSASPRRARSLTLAFNKVTGEVFGVRPIDTDDWSEITFEIDSAKGTIQLSHESSKMIFQKRDSRIAHFFSADGPLACAMEHVPDLDSQTRLNYNTFALLNSLARSRMTIALSDMSDFIFGSNLGIDQGQLTLDVQGLIAGISKSMPDLMSPRGSYYHSGEEGESYGQVTVDYVEINTTEGFAYWFYNLPSQMTPEQKEALVQISLQNVSVKKEYLSRHPFALPVILQNDEASRLIAGIASHWNTAQEVVDELVLVKTDEGMEWAMPAEVWLEYSTRRLAADIKSGMKFVDPAHDPLISRLRQNPLNRDKPVEILGRVKRTKKSSGNYDHKIFFPDGDVLGGKIGDFISALNNSLSP